MRALAVLSASTPSSGTLAQGHGLHLAAAAVFFLVSLGGIALAERPRPDGQPKGAVVRTRLSQTVAAAVAGAALVHFAVTPEHFREAGLLGVFFLVSGAAQLAFAALLARQPTHALLVVGVVANLAVVLLWLWTRTEGIPFGVGDAGAEPFGVLDSLASGLECVAVIGGGWLLAHGEQQSRAVVPART